MTWTHGGVAAAIQLACLALGVSLWAGAAVAVAAIVAVGVAVVIEVGK